MGEESATEWPDDTDPFGEAPLTEDTVEKTLAVEEEPTTDTEPQSSSDEISISPVENSPIPTTPVDSSSPSSTVARTVS